MGIILALVAFALCAIVYVRMVKREIPEPISKKQAIIPVAAGLAAPILATILIIIYGFIMKFTVGVPLAALSDSLLYKSLVTSFVGAGFTEEFVKFLLLLLLVKVLRPKNVYEYVLICVGISVGFTLLEEVTYGGGGGAITALTRIPAFGMHVRTPNGFPSRHCPLQQAEWTWRSRNALLPRPVSSDALAHRF